MDKFGMRKVSLGGKVDLYVMPDFPPESEENSMQNDRKIVVGRHEKVKKKEREKLMIGGRPVSIPPLRGHSKLQIMAAEEIRNEALEHFKPALQDFAPEQQMRRFLTLFLLKHLQAYSWLERASITDWAYYWRMMFETYLRTRIMKYERE